MGVSNIQKYKISKHAAKRIQTRFNIPKTKVETWTHRFLSAATFFKNEDEKNDEIQIFRSQDVLMVLDVEEYVVITAYPYNPLNKTNGLNPEILKLIRPSLQKLINDERIKLRDDLDGKMLDLQLAYSAYQNHPKTEEFLSEYEKIIVEITQRMEESQKVIDDIKNLTK